MSQASAESIFHAVQPALSQSLVPLADQEAVDRVLAGLLGSEGSFYLECRLGEPKQRQVDLLASITQYECDVIWRELSYRCRKQREVGLEGLVRLLGAWREHDSLLHRTVPVAWIELDGISEQAQQGRMAANVCVSLISSYINPYDPLSSQPVPRALDVAMEATCLVRGEPSSEDEQRQLKKCLERLPSGAHWIHLSVMSMRQPSALKLYGLFPQASLLGYLEAIEWPGDREEVKRLLARYCHADRTANLLYVDLPLAVGHADHDASVGLCFSQQQLRAARERDPGRSELLRELMYDGVCSAREVEALSSWAGPLRAPRERGVQRFTVDRWLDVKLVQRRAAPLLAKAYLGFSLQRAPVGLTLPVRNPPGTARCP